MPFFDIFSTSFLFSIAIIIILIGAIFAYVSYRIGEQDHKLNSMIGLISAMAEDSRYLTNKIHIIQQQLSGQELPVDDKIEYASQLMGGAQNELINVSDDEDDSDCEEDEDEYEDDEDDENEDESEDNESEDDENEDEEEEQTYKTINLSEELDLNIKIPYEEIDEDDKSYTIANNLVFDSTKDLAEFENTLEETDIQLSHETKETDDNNDFLNNISIKELGTGNVHLEEMDDVHLHKTEYKKMSLNKLRELVVNKGLVVDSSKLKKNELLKLLGDE
jgi:hypothetical protein